MVTRRSTVTRMRPRSTKERARSIPHFWLDPTRYAEVAEAIRDQLTTVDPDVLAEYTANATAFVAELDRIDGEFMTGLETCTHRT